VSAGPAREVLRSAGKHQASLGRLVADNTNQIEFLVRIAPPEFTADDMLEQARSSKEREDVLRSIARRAAHEAGLLEAEDDDAAAGSGVPHEGAASGGGDVDDDDVVDEAFVLKPGSAEMQAMLARHGLTEADLAKSGDGSGPENADGASKAITSKGEESKDSSTTEDRELDSDTESSSSD